jgi:hypothetical protein
MTIKEVWAQLEQELSWRHSEIRLLSNSRSSLRKEGDQDRFRRAQLVMLYAHAEGLCKVALLVYLNAINQKGIPRLAACDQLVASSLDGLFHALQFGDRKGKVFKSPPPADETLLLLSRRCDFVKEFDSIMQQPLRVPEAAVSTEDNLNSAVLRKCFLKLGFPLSLMESYEANLNELVNRRNNIAHGIDDGVVRATDYDRLQRAVFGAMDLIALAITEALEQESYMKPPTPFGSEPSLTAGEMR